MNLPTGSYPTTTRICTHCGRAYEGKGRAKYCSLNCRVAAYRAMVKQEPNRNQARNAVGLAIANGYLPSPKDLPCHDCGNAATEYDHYAGYEPAHYLEVQPVCRRCNIRRAQVVIHPGVMPDELHVRGVDPELWHQLRVEAVRANIPVGAALNACLRHCIDTGLLDDMLSQEREQK
jgi:hypothetical protein